MSEKRKFEINDYVMNGHCLGKIISFEPDNCYFVEWFTKVGSYHTVNTESCLKMPTLDALINFVEIKGYSVDIVCRLEVEIFWLRNEFQKRCLENRDANNCNWFRCNIGLNNYNVRLITHCMPSSEVEIPFCNIDTSLSDKICVRADSCISGIDVDEFRDLCSTAIVEVKSTIDTFKDMVCDKISVDNTNILCESDFDKVNFYERLNNEVDNRLTLTNNKQVPPVVYELRDLSSKVSIGDGVYLPRVWDDVWNYVRNLVKEEKEDMSNIANKLDNEKVNRILVNEKEGIVTVVGEKTKYVIVYGTQREKVVTMSKIVKGDKFNKYIGSAFALGYWHFGSKTKFNKHLQEFYGCAPQDMENCALMDMYNKYGGKAKFEKFVDDNAKYVIKEEKKPTPKKKPKSKKDKE